MSKGNPFVKITIAYIIGIFIYKFSDLNISTLNLILGFTFLSFVFLIMKIFTKSLLSTWKPSVVAIILFMLAGYINYKLTENKLNVSSEKLKDGFIIGTVEGIPKKTAKTIKIKLNINAIKHNNLWEKAEGKVIVYFKDSTALNLIPGEKIILNVILQDIRGAGNPEEFSYKNYLFFHFITKQAFVKAGNWSKIGNKFTIFDIGQIFRLKIIKLIDRSTLNKENKEILKALTLGYKDNIDVETKYRFSSTGAMHVLAVSGLHVGIIFIILNVLFFPLKKLKKGRLIVSILIIIFLWSYAIITGLSPSVTRATLMFTLIQIGIILKRQAHIYNTIAASAFIILLINPFIINEIGFWLSYLAVLGIITIYPHIYNSIYINKYKNFLLNVVDKIWALIAVSLSAQLATLPITLYFFHSFPTYFLITNLIVIPIVPFIMYSGLSMFLFNKNEALFNFASHITNYLLSFINTSLEKLQNLPYSQIKNIYISEVKMILLFGIIISFIVFLNTKRIKFLYALLVIFIFFTMYDIYEQNLKKHQKVFVVYNLGRYSAINFIDKTDNILLSNVYADKINLQYATKNFWLKLGVDKEKFIDINKLNNNYLFSSFWTINNPTFFFYNNYVKFHNLRIAIINKDFKPFNAKNKLKLNYIVIRDNPNIRIEKLLKMYDFDIIIFDSSNSKFKINKWENECKKLNVTFHNVKNQGAFIKYL